MCCDHINERAQHCELWIDAEDYYNTYLLTGRSLTDFVDGTNSSMEKSEYALSWSLGGAKARTFLWEFLQQTSASLFAIISMG